MSCKNHGISNQTEVPKTYLPPDCVGKTTLTQKSTGLIIEVEVMREPDNFTFSTAVCKEAKPGYELFQLPSTDTEDFDGSKI